MSGVGFVNWPGSGKVGHLLREKMGFKLLLLLLKKEEVVEVRVVTRMREGHRFLPNKTGFDASLRRRAAHLRLVLCVGSCGHGLMNHDVVRRVLLTRNR